MSTIRIIFALLGLTFFTGSGAMAQAKAPLNPETILYVTMQTQGQAQAFTVASLSELVKRQYQIDGVVILGASPEGSKLALVVHLLAMAMVGPTGSVSVGLPPTTPKISDIYSVSLLITHNSVQHEVTCRLQFEDKAPAGKVHLRRCQSKSAAFDDTEQTFESVGLKTTRREKVQIEKKH